MSVSGDFVTWLKGTDARIWQAVIGGSFLALGWLFNGWRNRHDARQERAERLRDVHKAIYAEIKSYTEGLGRDDLDSYEKTMVERMRQGEPDGGAFIPFIPIERNDTVFRAIVPDIHVLPRATIDTVVLYYSQLEAISALVEDMRSDAFAAIDVERRVNMYRDYINMKKLAQDIGGLCLQVIAAYADGGKVAAEAILLKRQASIAKAAAQEARKGPGKKPAVSSPAVNTQDGASCDR